MARPLIYTLGWFHRPTNKRLPKNTWLRSDRPPRDPPILRLPAGSQTSSSCSSSKSGLSLICLFVWLFFPPVLVKMLARRLEVVVEEAAAACGAALAQSSPISLCPLGEPRPSHSFALLGMCSTAWPADISPWI